MQGAMQDWPLTVNRFLDHANAWHAHRRVVSRGGDGEIRATTYGRLRDDAKRLSNALLSYGIRQGDRVATLAMNTAEHLTAWYAIAGIGAVCHTLNPRMAEDQLGYIVRHAGDRLIFADAAFGRLLARLVPECPSVEAVIVLPPADAASALPVAQLAWEELIAGQSAECRWGDFDERTAAGLCYTSGTTGDPKGVLYSHRSNVLHTLITLQADVFGLSVRDTVMPIVPMYHANSWGLAFSAPATGARLVLPGARLDPASLFELMQREGVTIAAGVPTVWLALLQHVAARGLEFATLRRVVVGGAACPERLIRDFAALSVDAVHAWGMTEMSPVGVVGSSTPEVAALPPEEQIPWRVKQGRAPFGVEMKITDPQGITLPQDGARMGSLRVRGPAVVSGYFGVPDAVLDAEGYFDTGDIATLDALGYMQIADRAKDIIKSGGEWISSLHIETVALRHAAVASASVIGIPDARWGERPLLLVVPAPQAAVCVLDLAQFLAKHLAKWQRPDRVVILAEFPLGPTGKIDKRALRADYLSGRFGSGESVEQFHP